MNAAPVPSAATAERRARIGSPAPTDWPTSTAAALETPSGTMNVSEAMLIATWCAAIGTVPRRPMRSATTANTPNSSWNWIPIGTPRRSICTIGLRRQTSRRQERRNGERSRQAMASSMTTMPQRASVHAIPAPIAPRTGLPRCPSTSTQHSAALSRFATTIVVTIGRIRPIAWRLCRSTTNDRNGRIPGIETRTNPAARGTTSAGWPRVLRTAAAGRKSAEVGSERTTAISRPRWTARATPAWSPAPTAWDTMGSSAKRVPKARAQTPKKYRLPSAVPARSGAETWPTMMVSTTPMNMSPTWTTTIGAASESRRRRSSRPGSSGRRPGTSSTGLPRPLGGASIGLVAAARGVEQRLGRLHLQAEQRVRQRLSLGVEPQRDRAPAIQRLVEQEVERPEVRYLVALHLAAADAAEAPLHGRRGERALEPRVDLGGPGDHADVADVALVAAPRVGEEAQRGRHLAHAALGARPLDAREGARLHRIEDGSGPVQRALAVASLEARLHLVARHQRGPVRHHLLGLRPAAGHGDAGRTREDHRRHHPGELLDLVLVGVADREAQQHLGGVDRRGPRPPARRVSDQLHVPRRELEAEPLPEQSGEGARLLRCLGSRDDQRAAGLPSVEVRGAHLERRGRRPATDPPHPHPVTSRLLEPDRGEVRHDVGRDVGARVAHLVDELLLDRAHRDGPPGPRVLGDHERAAARDS